MFKWEWSIRTGLLQFFIDEIMDNVCIMKQNKNVEYKKQVVAYIYVGSGTGLGWNELPWTNTVALLARASMT